MKTVLLPKEGCIDSHVHGRGLKQSNKTDPERVLTEAQKSGINISVFEPNTSPAIINIPIFLKYWDEIEAARKKLDLPMQYQWFGATDDNLEACDTALFHGAVRGLKTYPIAKDGKGVTTGTIGVAKDETILAGMRLGSKHQKANQYHCDDPEIIAKEGFTIRAEIEYVKKIIHLGKQVPRVKIIICHVSCRDSAELILAAQKDGLQIAMEIMPQYLWFDNDGTNWKPDLHANFYHCFNNLRGPEHREFLQSLLLLDNPGIWGASDSACHTKKEKEKDGMGGIPSNRHLVPVFVTLAIQLDLPQKRLAELLSWRAASFLGISVSEKLIWHNLVKKPDNSIIYNNGEVVSPWQDSQLLFPEPM